MFSQDELNEWYDSNVPDLDWIDKPSRHQFRWRTIEGKWITSHRRISDSKGFKKVFNKKAPADLYIGTSSWLDPIGLPRLSQTDLPAPILIDHLIVFDIDFRPFCYRRLEEARKSTDALVSWLESNENLELVYISYSGGKGFHVVLKDIDRTVFAIEDPREREKSVRKNRKDLLQRVLGAGFPVDKTVTADTRRIIRLPTSLHGSTGWVCTRISRDTLASPLRLLVKKIPRHSRARKMQYWPLSITEVPALLFARIKSPFLRKKPGKKQSKIKLKHKGEPETITSLQASSHVVGTKDRSAIILWLPKHWKEKQRSKFQVMLEQNDWHPAHVWKSEGRELVIVPRAIPKQQLEKILPRVGLPQTAAQISNLGHYWTDVSPRKFSLQGMEEEMEYVGQMEMNTKKESPVPWSSTHLELLNRLGLIIAVNGDEVAGNPTPSLRMVKKE